MYMYLSTNFSRYFQLVVSLEAVLANRSTIILTALATQKIIVRYRELSQVCIYVGI